MTTLSEAIDEVPLETDHTGERILAAALRQFEELGLRRTTVEDVARRAGISRVTVYRRFSSKEALVDAVILDEARRFFGELDAAVAHCEATDEILAEGFAFALHRLRDHTLLNRLLETEPESILPLLTIESRSVLDLVRGRIARRIGSRLTASGWDAPDVEAAAEMLLRIVFSFVLTPHSIVALDTRERAREFAFRYLSPALHSVAAGD